MACFDIGFVQAVSVMIVMERKSFSHDLPSGCCVPQKSQVIRVFIAIFVFIELRIEQVGQGNG